MARSAIERLDSALGGSARRRVLLPLAGVLGLAGADLATIGASATQLRASLHLTHTDLGLLAAVTGLVAGIAAVPLGTLVDRINRTRLLAAGVALWAIVMAASAASQSFAQLVLIRCLLGGVVAVATPATASLIGDYFSPTERARIWGYVLTGELLGTGVGFSVAGGLASLSWRASFVALGLPALGLAYLIWRLPEPVRGGNGRIPEGATELRSDYPDRASGDDGGEEFVMSETQRAVIERAAPYENLVLEEDPSRWPLRRAVRYVLSIRTNVYLIIAGSAGYFFFSGARAFGIEYVKTQYCINQGVASTITLVLGGFAIAGVLASGWISDRVGAHGHPRFRVYFAGVMLAVAIAMFLPALLATSLGPGLLFLGLAAAALASINPPVDAGRLDIMHPMLWGRAEAVRNLLKQPAEALAPLLFGLIADHVDGGGHAGLQVAFLVMLVPLVASVFVILHARHTYPRDVATAAESIRRNHVRRQRVPARHAARPVPVP